MSHRYDPRDRWGWESQRDRETADLEREVEAPFGRDIGDPRWGTGGMRGGPPHRQHLSHPSAQGEGEPPRSYPYESSYRDRGSTGPYVGKAPRGYRRTDEHIREEVCDRFTEHGELDPTDVEVSVHGGEVVLVGTVATRAQKRLAEEIVDGVSGVVEVHNHLRVPRASDAEQGPSHGEFRDGPTYDDGVVHR